MASGRSGVHPVGIADPRSADFHASSLRAQRWAPILDKDDPASCGLCHEGLAARPDGVRYPAPGAPACTSCHQEGVLGCATCHEKKPSGGAHSIHLAPAGQGVGLACSSCHPMPEASVIGGLHGDGRVDVVFDPTQIAPGASYDQAAGSCVVYCHDHGGARARPGWNDQGKMRCGDCHGSPPDKHYPGLCSTCHQEPNGDGTTLAAGPFHLNGKVELGDGSGGCEACHQGGPESGAHQRHRTPLLTTPVGCAECHPSYDSPQSPGHLDGEIHLEFGPRARFFGASPAWNGASCDGVACHGAGLSAPSLAPAWQDTSGAASQCGACHGVPPKQHTPSVDCGRADCHGGAAKREGSLLFIPPEGRALHINGKLDVNR